MQVALRFPGRLLAGLLFVLLAGRIAAQAPVITLNPVSQTNTVGSLASFTVEATGTLPLTYDYYFNGFKVSTFTNGIISFPVSSVLEAGTYLAVVTNALGSATSAPATLTVLGPPVFSMLPQPQTVFAGQTATFSAEVLSAVPVTYQWLFQNNAIQNATNATLILPNVVTNQIGFYAVQARNEYGTRTSLGG